MTEPESAPPLIRVFIAVELDAAVRAALSRAQAKLKRAGAHVSWVPEDNLHISLAFLGDVDVSTVDVLSGAINGISAARNPFQCSVENLGTFGKPSSPRVIWAGVGQNDALSDLQRHVSECVQEASIPLEDRPYTAHVTLGRVRSARGKSRLVDAMSPMGSVSFGTLTVSRVVIMRSILGDSGATYRVLRACPLGRPQAE